MFASLCCQFFSFLQDAHADVKMEIGFKYANKLLSNDIEAIECKRERERKKVGESLYLVSPFQQKMLYFNASDASNENAQQIFSFFNCHLKWINGQKDFFTNKPVE